MCRNPQYWWIFTVPFPRRCDHSLAVHPWRCALDVVDAGGEFANIVPRGKAENIGCDRAARSSIWKDRIKAGAIERPTSPGHR